MNRWTPWLLSGTILAGALWQGSTSRAADESLRPHLAKLQAVGPKGAGHRDAINAWKAIAAVDAKQLPEVLAGLDSSNPLAANWFRSACETIASRELAKGGKLPVAALELFLASTDRDPLARRLAYELIARVDMTAEARLIPGLVNDPSLELRRDALTLALKNAEQVAANNNQAATIKAYSDIFRSARDPDQIKIATDKLRALEQKVDVATHYGFLMNWQVVAPFDNTDTKGFDIAYPPETEVKLDASYDGKSGKISWKPISTKDDFGAVDLNASLEKHKGAIAYAFTTFVSAKEQTVELRLGTPNANKVWLNGQLVTANNIYHANTALDQYVGRGKLIAGRNTILVKLAQNEQTEAWAQEWKFQLRVCDKIGTAVLSQDRPSEQTASATSR